MWRARFFCYGYQTPSWFDLGFICIIAEEEGRTDYYRLQAQYSSSGTPYISHHHIAPPSTTKPHLHPTITYQFFQARAEVCEEFL